MINVALIGVGNNASALVQGVEYYKKNPIDITGITPEIEEFGIDDIYFKLGIDIDVNKVGKDLSEGIFVHPNCSVEIFRPKKLGATIFCGRVFDGMDSSLVEYISSCNYEESHCAYYSGIFEENDIDVVVILLPTGSNNAAMYYAREAVLSGCAVVNGMPALIANSTDLGILARKHEVPIIGDDIKSQIGATIVHRALAELFPMRSSHLSRTIQLDWGGGMDFANLLSNNRYEKGKRNSKTNSVIYNLPNRNELEVKVSAVDYIPFLGSTKEAYMRLEGKIFGGQPVKIELTMQVQDNFNAAGPLVDCIRIAKIALERKHTGVLHPAASFFMKNPPIQLSDSKAYSDLISYMASY